MHWVQSTACDLAHPCIIVKTFSASHIRVIIDVYHFNDVAETAVQIQHVYCVWNASNKVATKCITTESVSLMLIL